MIFHWGQRKHARSTTQHKWFAWRPVHIAGSFEYRWLEFVLRNRIANGWSYSRINQQASDNE